jgi:2'-5' RNA ligase
VSSLRCFVGIPLDDGARSWCAQAQELLAAAAPGWAHEKWVDASNLHVTVRFLGQIDEEKLPTMADGIGASLRHLGVFDLEITRVAARPSPRRVRLLWAACSDPSGGFAYLARAVTGATKDFVAIADEREPVPHVTLCRARGHRTISADVLSQVNGVLEETSPTMSVPSVSLFSSRLAPRGPEYQQIATWRLRGE